MPAADDPIRLYAEYIIDAPDEWTPEFTRSELLPMARAYVENERLRTTLARIRNNAEGWHGDDAAKGRALAVIAEWAQEALDA